MGRAHDERSLDPARQALSEATGRAPGRIQSAKEHAFVQIVAQLELERRELQREDTPASPTSSLQHQPSIDPWSVDVGWPEDEPEPDGERTQPLETYERTLACSACEQAGVRWCLQCNGAGTPSIGTLPETDADALMDVVSDVEGIAPPRPVHNGGLHWGPPKCGTCGGSGRERCPNCKGNGRVRSTPMVVATRWVDTHSKTLEPDAPDLPHGLAMTLTEGAASSRELLRRSSQSASELLTPVGGGAYREAPSLVRPEVDSELEQFVRAKMAVQDARLHRIHLRVTEIPVWEVRVKSAFGEDTRWLYGDPPTQWGEGSALPSRWGSRWRAARKWVGWTLLAVLLATGCILWPHCMAWLSS